MKAAAITGLILAAAAAAAVALFAITSRDQAASTPNAADTPRQKPQPTHRALNGRFPDVDFALADLCYPFLLENVAPEDLMVRTRVTGELITQDGNSRVLIWGPDRDSFMSLAIFPEGRFCVIAIAAPETKEVRDTIKARFRQWPVELEPATIRGMSENGGAAFCAIHPEGGYAIASYRPMSNHGGIGVFMGRVTDPNATRCTIPG